MRCCAPISTSRQIVELSVLIGLYNMHTRVFTALGIDPERRITDQFCFPGAAQHGAQRNAALLTRDRCKLGARCGPAAQRCTT